MNIDSLPINATYISPGTSLPAMLTDNTIEAPTLSSQEWSVDVPHDGSCLLWAVALAYLIPAKNNSELLKQRLQQLFGEMEEEKKTALIKLLKDYHPWSDTLIFEEQLISSLVTETLRGRLINHMLTHSSDFEPYYVCQNPHEHNFQDYLSRLHDPSAWLGGLEIRAMSQLLNCKIELGEETYKPSELEKGDVAIKLLHTEGTHYRFILHSQIIENDWSLYSHFCHEDQIAKSRLKPAKNPQKEAEQKAQLVHKTFVDCLKEMKKEAIEQNNPTINCFIVHDGQPQTDEWVSENLDKDLNEVGIQPILCSKDWIYGEHRVDFLKTHIRSDWVLVVCTEKINDETPEIGLTKSFLNERYATEEKREHMICLQREGEWKDIYPIQELVKPVDCRPDPSNPYNPEYRYYRNILSLFGYMLGLPNSTQYTKNFEIKSEKISRKPFPKNKSQEVREFVQKRKKTTRPPFRWSKNDQKGNDPILQKIRFEINKGEYENALYFLLFWLTNIAFEGSPLAVYDFLCDILKGLNEHQFTEMKIAVKCVNTLMQKYPNPEGQLKLVMTWVQFFCQANIADPFDKDYGNCFEAMWLYAEALNLCDASSQKLMVDEINRKASHLFFPFIKACFEEELGQAVGSNNYEKFKSLIDRLQYVCSRFLSNHRDDLFKRAREAWSNFIIRDPKEQSELSGEILFQPQTNISTIEIATYQYRKALNDFRHQFKEEFKSIASSVVDIHNIKAFQEKVFNNWICFFSETFLQDAFAILGPPPCDYSLELLGSYARLDFGPHSRLEWMILFSGEDQKAQVYFKRLARLIELQMISLGESPGKNSAIYIANSKLGFSIDIEANPSQNDLIFKVPLHPQLYAVERCSEKLLLRYSRTLNFKNLQKENLLFQEKNIQLRQAQALELLNRYLSNCSGEFSNQDLKNDLIYLLHGLALYYGIEEGNSIAIAEELTRREFFTEESGSFLQHSLAELYLIDLQQQFGLIDSASSQRLEKIYWLALRPLYRALKRGLRSVSKLDLLKCTFFEENFQPETVANLHPLIVHVVHHFAKTNQGCHKTKVLIDLHKPFYNYLSMMTFADPLRETYLNTLQEYAKNPSIKNLINYLAKIPTPSGFRQSYRLENEYLQEAILAMTTDNPEGDKPAFIKSPTMQSGRYLRKEVLDQVLTPAGDVKQMYNNSAHAVAFASYSHYHLHFKQKPIHPLMEYAVHALTERITGHMTPPTELARLEVQGKVYPVLISKTVDGTTLAKAGEFDLKSYTWGCLCALLTRPGDGHFSNYVVESKTKRIFCVDNDLSFFEPVTSAPFGRHETHFCSALFCLNPQPLDQSVLKAFTRLSPALILHSWMDELIEKDKLYQQLKLFSDEEETKFYEEDRNNRFKSTLLLRSGTIATLLLQFHHLQNFLLEELKLKKTLYPIDLLAFLMAFRGEQHQSLKRWVYEDYQKAMRTNVDPQERLQNVLKRSSERSMTSLQSDPISFGKLPSLDEIKARETFSPEKAREELFAFSLEWIAPSIAGGLKLGQEYLEARFEEMIKRVFDQFFINPVLNRWREIPDIERQSFVLKALAFVIKKKSRPPKTISLTDCAALDFTHLKPFLHADLEKLTLDGCSQIKKSTINKINKQCPNLKELYLNRCEHLKSIDHSFDQLQVLQISDCPELKTIRLKAPNLRELKANDNLNLRTFDLMPEDKYRISSFEGCPSAKRTKGIIQKIRNIIPDESR